MPIRVGRPRHRAAAGRHGAETKAQICATETTNLPRRTTNLRHAKGKRRKEKGRE
jgi:hypothetical protein